MFNGFRIEEKSSKHRDKIVNVILNNTEGSAMVMEVHNGQIEMFMQPKNGTLSEDQINQLLNPLAEIALKEVVDFNAKRKFTIPNIDAIREKIRLSIISKQNQLQRMIQYSKKREEALSDPYTIEIQIASRPYDVGNNKLSYIQWEEIKKFAKHKKLIGLYGEATENFLIDRIDKKMADEIYNALSKGLTVYLS